MEVIYETTVPDFGIAVSKRERTPGQYFERVTASAVDQTRLMEYEGLSSGDRRCRSRRNDP